MKQLLTNLKACSESIDWIGDRTIEQAIADCHRGDWILWLAKKLDVDKRKLTLAKALCANTVRHLMKDELSIKAVDAAIAYGNGEIDDVQLASAYAASASVASACAAHVDYAASACAAYAAHVDYAASACAAYAASACAAYAASVASDAAVASAYASDAAYKENQMKTANICREVIGQLIIDKVKQK